MSSFDHLLPEDARLQSTSEVGVGLTRDRPNVVELRRWGRPFRPLAFQQQIIDGIAERVSTGTNTRGLLCLPTGSGKTVTTACAVLNALCQIAGGSGVALWIAPQRELLFQAIDAVQSAWWSGANPAQVDLRILADTATRIGTDRASILFSTPLKLDRLRDVVGSPDILIFDEAHHAAAVVFGRIWNSYLRQDRPPRLALGLSATPFRTKREEQTDLTEQFDETLLLPRSLYPNPVRALIDAGVLARPRFHLIQGVSQASRADVNAADRRRILSLIRDPERWAATVRYICDTNEQTVVFAGSREHGEALTRHLRYQGVAAEYVDGETPINARAGIFERFSTCRARVIVNVSLLVEGVDCPAAKIAVLTHPIGSKIRLSQMIGRVLRGPAVGGSSECTIAAFEGSQDHVDAAIELQPFHVASWSNLTLL